MNMKKSAINIIPEDTIDIRGARVHNLKNIDLQIPKTKLVVITGISGSGKSSLAFDTIFAEGQRRYMESFAAYARQFMGDLERPDVDSITGLSPVISIEQKTTNRNPRSTVGTVTEVYDFIRLLFARTADAYSMNTGKKMVRFTEEEVCRHILEQYADKKIIILAPIVRGRKGHYRELFENLRKQGYVRARIDGTLQELREKMQLDRYKVHDIELVIDRLVVKPDITVRLSQGIQQAFRAGQDLVYILETEANSVSRFSRRLMCADTGLSYEEPSPNTFSFNSPYGACPECRGLGTIHRINMAEVIPDEGKSLKEGAIVPLGAERDGWAFKQAMAAAAASKIPATKPYREIPPEKRNILLYGNEAGILTYRNEEDSPPSGNYEGILNMILRWFHETTSDAIRDWAAKFLQLDVCPVCEGTRLKRESLFFKIAGKNIAELSGMPLDALAAWFGKLYEKLSARQAVIAKDVLREIEDRLRFLLDVGLHYLSLNRPSRTLSGGESQRIRLATQIGSSLTGITYILDEPSIGLHQRDNHKLIEALRQLRDGGNSVLVVEHDRDIMLAADYLIDIGPAAGIHGGTIVSKGSPEAFLQGDSITARYLKRNMEIAVPSKRRTGNGKKITLKGVTGNNLKNITVHFPLGMFICITGVSGSGKSTLINETLYPVLAKHCYPVFKHMPMPYKKAEGIEFIDKVIEIDQSPIGRTPRSNPATYCGFFNEIRQLFSQIPEAKIRGYLPGRFSFNVKGGRCEHCQGGGMRVIEMNFLPDVYVVCEQCQGKRYNRETLEIRYKGKSIADVLALTVDEAVAFFSNIPALHHKLRTLQDVGLGYITLGQNAVTLSGGEAQRVKLATELSKRDTGKTVYILDEPTTGLHFEDIQHLISVLNRLTERGNTVIVIEHNLDVIKVADYIIDIGPEGGAGGGNIVGTGTPEEIALLEKSHTGKYLKEELQSRHLS